MFRIITLQRSTALVRGTSRRAVSSAAATPAAATEKADIPTRYMPPTAQGRYIIEQEDAHWSSCIAAVNFAPGEVIGTAPGIFVRSSLRLVTRAGELTCCG
jgi:hypothetical protein